MSRSATREIDVSKLQTQLKKVGLNQTTLWKAVGMNPSTANSYVSRGEPFDDNILAKIAGELKCTVDMFTRPARQRLPLLTTAEIRTLYADITADAFVWIFSADGFIERDQRNFYNIICNALGKGISIYYFFPMTAHANNSIEAFQEIVGRFRADIAQNITDQVKGFFIASEGAFLYAQSSRFVVIGKELTTRKRVERILLYVHAHGDYWIEMEELARRQDFVAEMLEVIDPIEHRPPELWGRRWRLPPQVKEAYRISFNKVVGEESYEVVRKLANTRERVRELSTDVAARLLDSSAARRPFISWLDIGCEDGANTAVALDVLQKKHLNVSLTAIETSTQSDPEVILKYSNFINNRSFEEFALDLPRSHKYDLITSIHSWYLIDPLHLLTAYRMLSESGILAVVIAPYSNNVFNEITRVIDAEIAERNKLTEGAYPAKKITADPYRNYAEDIEEACRELFGADNVQLSIKKGSTERHRLMKGASLSDEAKSVVKFFCHRTITADQNLYKKVAAALMKFGTDDLLPCDEWHIVLERASIIEKKRGELFKLG